MKVALSEFSGLDVKEIESRRPELNEKIKKEKEMQQKSKKATGGSNKKKFINTGSTKGTPGLTITSTIMKTWTISTISCR